MILILLIDLSLALFVTSCANVSSTICYQSNFAQLDATQVGGVVITSSLLQIDDPLATNNAPASWYLNGALRLTEDSAIHGSDVMPSCPLSSNDAVGSQLLFLDAYNATDSLVVKDFGVTMKARDENGLIGT
jgi:hypothetical protein